MKPKKCPLDLVTQKLLVTLVRVISEIGEWKNRTCAYCLEKFVCGWEEKRKKGVDEGPEGGKFVLRWERCKQMLMLIKNQWGVEQRGDGWWVKCLRNPEGWDPSIAAGVGCGSKRNLLLFWGAWGKPWFQPKPEMEPCCAGSKNNVLKKPHWVSIVLYHALGVGWDPFLLVTPLPADTHIHTHIHMHAHPTKWSQPCMSQQKYKQGCLGG